MLNSVLAPAGGTPPGEADRDNKSGVVESEGAAWVASSESDPLSSGAGRAGRFVFAGRWKDKSVGDIYPWAFEGPASSGGSSSMGVMGGGGVDGVDGMRELRGVPVSGEDARGADEGPVGLGRLDLCERREDAGDAATGGEPTPEGLAPPPPTSSKMLPRSLP